MKATDLLRQDHEKQNAMLEQLQTGNTGGRSRDELRTEILRELSIHAAIEETIVYPVARQLLPDQDFEIREDLEEHHVLKLLGKELKGMDVEDERFLPKAKVLAENNRHHTGEEEDELFPALEEVLDADDLEELGERLAEAKDVAPTRPHPGAPDEPPANLVNLGAAVLDRLRDRVGA